MDSLVLPFKQYNRAGEYLGIRDEQCKIEAVSRHLVMLRRPSGRRESKTLVELCQMERGAE